MLHEFLQFIGQILMEAVCHFVGRLVVRIVTFGRWRCDTPDMDLAKKPIGSRGLYSIRNQTVHLAGMTTTLIGLFTLIFLIGGGALTFYLLRW
ncbi:MAG: hypothetical protein NTW19_01620 [Planctomycetota bacterium]|nr:hypothetical protein [Planctomycetota bacterium]